MTNPSRSERHLSVPDYRPELTADPREVVSDERDIGWRCGPCGWETFDLADMHKFVNWREPNGSISMVCPRCGAEGQFVDAERARP